MQVPGPAPSPTRNMVRDISGTSFSDAWAVGIYEAPLFKHNGLLCGTYRKKVAKPGFSYIPGKENPHEFFQAYTESIANI